MKREAQQNTGLFTFGNVRNNSESKNIVQYLFVNCPPMAMKASMRKTEEALLDHGT